MKNLFSALGLVVGIFVVSSAQAQILVDADTPETGSNLGTEPLVTSAGTITFTGEFRDGPCSDDDFIAAGASGNCLDIDDAGALLEFSFPVCEVTFIYGGNSGEISIEARAGTDVLDSFYQASTDDGQPAGPETLSGNGITELFWNDTQGSYAPLDNIAIIPCDAGVATFKVTKTFSDLNDAEVDVMLSCNSGLPLEQDFTIAGGDEDGVTFVVTDIPETGADCEVTESGGPTGYTTILNGGDGCAWTDVTGGSFTCEITNEADDATYTVVKDWVQEGTGGDIINAVADVTIKCNSQIDNLDPAKDGYWYKSGDLGDGGILEASVDVTQGPATCSASEQILQSGVESVAEGCGEVDLGPGGSQTCTFTNTVFFEGIPTLSQYGLAILVLLMLGVGFIGMRRFV